MFILSITLKEYFHVIISLLNRINWKILHKIITFRFCNFKILKHLCVLCQWQEKSIIQPSSVVSEFSLKVLLHLYFSYPFCSFCLIFPFGFHKFTLSPCNDSYKTAYLNYLTYMKQLFSYLGSVNEIPESNNTTPLSAWISSQKLTFIN